MDWTSQLHLTPWSPQAWFTNNSTEDCIQFLSQLHELWAQLQKDVSQGTQRTDASDPRIDYVANLGKLHHLGPSQSL